MKVIIQIPCYNEEASLPVTLGQLPRRLEGAAQVEWLVIDDGSTDRTAEVARAHGADHVVRLGCHRGLAAAFLAGVNACLERGADAIVNTDADNQYRAADIGRLLDPVLRGEADFVVGARPIESMAHFAWSKKLLQRAGSRVVRWVSGAPVEDAPSGFRAFTREAALRMNVFDPYTYTLETIVQAQYNGLRVMSVPVGVNPDLRPSRLVRSTPQYVGRSVLTLARISMLYRPFRTFSLLAAVPAVAAAGLAARWILLHSIETPVVGRSRVPSLVAAAVCATAAGLLFLLGVVADLLAANRRILEEIRVMMRRQRGA